MAGVFYWRRWQIVGGSSAVGLHGLLETPWLSFVAWLALLGRYIFFLVFVRLLFVLFCHFESCRRRGVWSLTVLVCWISGPSVRVFGYSIIISNMG